MLLAEDAGPVVATDSALIVEWARTWQEAPKFGARAILAASWRLWVTRLAGAHEDVGPSEKQAGAVSANEMRLGWSAQRPASMECETEVLELKQVDPPYLHSHVHLAAHSGLQKA